MTPCFRGGFATRGKASSGGGVPVGEPFYTGLNQTLIYQSNFNTYNTFADAVADNWFSSNRLTTQDTSNNAAGANQIISPGSDGTGKAIRLVYMGTQNDGGTQEAHAWDRAPSGTPAGRFNHAVYVQYMFRINPGGGFHIDDSCQAISSHNIQIKNIELWGTANAAERAQFSLAYSFVTNGLPTTLMDFFPVTTYITFPPQGTGANYSMGGQCQPPYFCSNEGLFKRVTYKYMTQSAVGARDGLAQAWYDGTKILDVSAATAGVAVPGAQGTPAGQKWCEAFHLDFFAVDDPFGWMTLGSVNSGNLWPYTLDYDSMAIWYDT